MRDGVAPPSLSPRLASPKLRANSPVYELPGHLPALFPYLILNSALPGWRTDSHTATQACNAVADFGLPPPGGKPDTACCLRDFYARRKHSFVTGAQPQRARLVGLQAAPRASAHVCASQGLPPHTSRVCQQVSLQAAAASRRGARPCPYGAHPAQCRYHWTLAKRGSRLGVRCFARRQGALKVPRLVKVCMSLGTHHSDQLVALAVKEPLPLLHGGMSG